MGETRLINISALFDHSLGHRLNCHKLKLSHTPSLLIVVLPLFCLLLEYLTY